MNATTRHLTRALAAVLEGERPRLPEGGGPLWTAFLDLSAARSGHAHGPNPISYAEILAYARLMRLPLAPHHVRTIRALDDAWLAHVRGPAAGKKGATVGQRQALTGAMFDAVFG